MWKAKGLAIFCALSLPAAAEAGKASTPQTARSPAYWRVQLPRMTFAFQSYNNCGPQVLSSVLGYYGPDLVLSYDAFTQLWQVYDSEFIPVYPANLETWVYKVLGVL